MLRPVLNSESDVTKREPNAKRLMRLKEGAQYLSMSPGSLRSIVQRGELPIIKLGDTGHSPWLIDVRDLDSWIERSKAIIS